LKTMKNCRHCDKSMDNLKKVAQEIYDCIDNDLYHADGDSWWQSDTPFYLIQSSVNPARVGYFKNKLFNELKVNPQGKAALEVGCGGGVLCEEIARMGFEVTGIDPSEHSLQIGTSHAKANMLRINYEKGTGEALPHRDNSVDIVFCCDVLEHVRDVPKVISEISRVLKPGGVFCYDTFNRTFMSKLVAINISQVWKRWAFAPSNLHVWKMFIKPDELISLLRLNHLEWKEHWGMEPNVSLLVLLHYLRKRARGEITYKDLGEKLFMVKSSNMRIMYMGYAIKSQ
jgi:2-polyprenyl-6-hydroxyphenyl methylase / 3-demethylubiquinone-9 3-methyltransferase